MVPSRVGVSMQRQRFSVTFIIMMRTTNYRQSTRYIAKGFMRKIGTRRTKTEKEERRTRRERFEKIIYTHTERQSQRVRELGEHRVEKLVFPHATATARRSQSARTTQHTRLTPDHSNGSQINVQISVVHEDA